MLPLLLVVLQQANWDAQRAQQRQGDKSTALESTTPNQFRQLVVVVVLVNN